jgi:hypothetical protein
MSAARRRHQELVGVDPLEEEEAVVPAQNGAAEEDETCTAATVSPRRRILPSRQAEGPG